MDGSMEQIAILDKQGLETVDTASVRLASQQSAASDSNIFLWNAGATMLGIMDLDTMEYDLVEGMGGSAVGESLSHAMLSVSNGRKLVTVTNKKQLGACYVNYWQKRAGACAVQRLVESIDDESRRR